MKAGMNRLLIGLLSFILMVVFSDLMGAEGNYARSGKGRKAIVDSLQYKVYRGSIQDKDSKEPLIFAAISVKGTNVATISNSDGDFLLKVAKDIPAESITISHIGYKNLDISINDLKVKKNNLKMESEAVPLDEINIYPLDPAQLVRNVLRNITENYSVKPNMMEGFYRETIKRNRHYVAISEAVIDIHKSGYRQYKNDQVRIFKGRKSENVKKMDTLMFKLQGGPSTTLLLDIIKNPYVLLTDDLVGNYEFDLKNVTKINDKLHYVVEFKQKEYVDYPLYYGLFYIEADNLVLTSAKFSLNLEDEEETSKMFIRKKPVGVKVTPTVANYLVNYIEQDGKWYFNYAREEVTFRCNWKRKLFNTNYSAMSEIAITDRDSENIIRFKGSDQFRMKDVMIEEVGLFEDKDFWGAHNTIEPDQSIESAIRKLKKR